MSILFVSSSAVHAGTLPDRSTQTDVQYTCPVCKAYGQITIRSWPDDCTSSILAFELACGDRAFTVPSAAFQRETAEAVTMAAFSPCPETMATQTTPYASSFTAASTGQGLQVPAVICNAWSPRTHGLSDSRIAHPVITHDHAHRSFSDPHATETLVILPCITRGRPRPLDQLYGPTRADIVPLNFPEWRDPCSYTDPPSLDTEPASAVDAGTDPSRRTEKRKGCKIRQRLKRLGSGSGGSG